MFGRTLALSVCLSLASLLPSAARTCAQSLSGVQIGDDLTSAVKQIGFPPNQASRSGPFSSAKWRLGDGNELSVTMRTGEGKIIFMESDWGGWNGGRGESETDFPDFFFGRTTRQQIISKMGNEGVLYNYRFPFDVQPDKWVVFDAIYDVSGTDVVVDFVTRIDEAQMRLRIKKLKNYKNSSSNWHYVGASGLLVAIILGKRDYVQSEWGQRVATLNYRPVALEALQPQPQRPKDGLSKQPDEIRLSLRNGVSFVPVKINDRLVLDFVVDSGAADVQIPDDVFRTLLRTGTISRKDFLGTSTYVLADGTEVPSDRYLIRKMEIGNHVVGNVVASIGNPQSQLLLGQSFLSKLGSWTLDNERHVLVLSDKR
jgi:predicted aspartyl protease